MDAIFFLNFLAYTTIFFIENNIKSEIKKKMQ